MPGSIRLLSLVAPLLLVAACGASSRPPSTPRPAPPASVSPATASVQELFEAGRYGEVLANVPEDSADADLQWLAAHTYLRQGQREDAQRRFERLREVSSDPARQAAADLALATLAGNDGAIDAARTAAGQYSGDPIAQFELGRAAARRNDFTAAAQAFDRCAELNPRFAYAYYNAALAYERINRTDLSVIRFEMFQRLAPQAPERPEVEALLRSVRAR